MVSVKITSETVEQMTQSLAAAARVRPKFEQLSPEDQLLYGDWTAQQLEVLLPLIAPDLADEN